MPRREPTVSPSLVHDHLPSWSASLAPAQNEKILISVTGKKIFKLRAFDYMPIGRFQAGKSYLFKLTLNC